MGDTFIYTIKTPEGEEFDVEGPANATDEQIQSFAADYLKKIRPEKQYAPANIQRQEPETFTDKLGNFAGGVAHGIAKPWDNAADYLAGAFGQDAPPAAQEMVFGLPTSGGGEVVGNIIGTGLLTRGMGGPFTQGALSGALTTDSDTATGIGVDMLAGGVGGKIGDAVIGKAAGAIAPKVDEAAQFLREQGIRMTPGQAVPSFKRTEDKLMSWPGIGDKIRDARDQSLEDFNRVAVQETLTPLGITLPKGVKTGNQAVKFAGDRLSNRYEKLLPKLAIKADDQFAQDIAALRPQIENGELSPNKLRQFEAIIRNQVMGRLTGNEAGGLRYRAVDKSLGNLIRRYEASTNPEDAAMAEAFGAVRSSLNSLLERSNPAAQKELQALNGGWASLVRVEGAAANAKGGIFSPDQFRTAVRRADTSTRKRDVARGEARMQQLAEAGAEVLPAELGNSGTSDRQALSLTDPRLYMGYAMSPFYGTGTQNALAAGALAPRPPAAGLMAKILESLPSPQISNALLAPLTP